MRTIVTATVLLAAAGAAAVAACGAAARGPTSGMSREVVETLRATGEARVVVALALPDGFDAEPGGEEARAEIARVQDRVLADLGPDHFRLQHRFTAVPALAGAVLTEEGLRILAGHPDVIRVDLDEAGGGAADHEPRGAT